TGQVESFARNCDNIPHGNTCIRDPHLITCYQTCTSDLCNSGNPDPVVMGTTTLDKAFTVVPKPYRSSQASKVIEAGDSLRGPPQNSMSEPSKGVNAAASDRLKKFNIESMNIVPYKSKVGRYVVKGNTVRHVGTTHKWWLADTDATKKLTDNYVTKENMNVLSAPASRDEPQLTRPKAPSLTSSSNSEASSPKKDNLKHTSEYVSSVPLTKLTRNSKEVSEDKSRHSFDYISYVPLSKPKPTTPSKQWFSESSFPRIRKTTKSRQMWYDVSSPTQATDTESHSTTPVKPESNNKKGHLVLRKPLKPTQPTQNGGPSTKTKTQNTNRIQIRPTEQIQSKIDNLQSKSKLDHPGLSSEVAELLPILEALITDGSIALDDATVTAVPSTQRAVISAKPTPYPTYGLLETANIYTSHVHGRKFTQKPIHQTINKRYRKKLAKSQRSTRGDIRVTPDKLVPEPYIVSFFNKGANPNQTEPAAARSNNSSPAISNVPETISMSVLADKNLHLKTDSSVERNYLKVEPTLRIIIVTEKPDDVKSDDFWHKLSTVSKNAKSEMLDLRSLNLQDSQTVTPVPTDANSLTISPTPNTQLELTSPSQNVNASKSSKTKSRNVYSLLSKNKEISTHFKTSPKAGKSQTAKEVTYVSVYPQFKATYNRSKENLVKKSAMAEANDVSRRELVPRPGVVYVSPRGAVTTLPPISVLKVEFSDASDTFTILTESKKNSQRSKLYSAALTNVDYLNEVNRKIGEKLKAEIESGKDNSGLYPTTSNVTTTKSDMVTKIQWANQSRMPNGVTPTTTLRNSTTTNDVIGSISNSYDLGEVHFIGISDNAQNTLQNESTTNTPSAGEPETSQSTLPKKDSGTNVELFRTTGVNSDFSFKASVGVDTSTSVPSIQEQTVEKQLKTESDMMQIHVHPDEASISDSINSDTFATKSDDLQVTFTTTLEPTSSSLQKTGTISNLITSGLREVNEAKKEKLNESSHQGQVPNEQGKTTPLPDKDKRVIIAYEDTLNELLRNVRGSSPAPLAALSSRSTLAPTIFIKPALHLPGKIAKLEGKKKLFSSKRANSSTWVQPALTYWYLVGLVLVSILRF
ncbi:protein PFC0760c, partial [Biomphalaria glabrata]